MARRSSARSMFFALLAAAGTGAAQLGLGYGLGIISWAPSVTAATAGGTAGSSAALTAVLADGAWSSGLAWTTWVSATSVVVGAVVGDRLLDSADSGRFARAAWRLVLALAA